VACTQPREVARAVVELSFERIYEQYFPFVWRSLLRLGVSQANIDDAAQDAFLVVHRRLADFEGRASVKTWLFSVAQRVALNYRRRERKALSQTPVPLSLLDGRPG